MEEEDLIHCIYASAATVGFGELELEALLRHSRANNGRLGLTGMLLHVEGSFIQVLEGNATAVDALYARIAADPRHTGVTRIIRESIPARAFGDWTMGYSRPTRAEIESLDGLNDFFEDGTCLSRLDGGRAKKLLARFAQGRWRICSSRAPAQMAAA